MTEDNQIQQLIDYFSLLTGRELHRLFGEQKGDALHSLYDRQFRIHYNNYKHMMPIHLAKRHGINSLFVMALDDTLREIKASYSQLKVSVISIYKEMLQTFFESEVRHLEESVDPWGAFIEWIRKGNRANYDNEFFKVLEIQQDDQCFGFDIQKCLYFDILREAGRPELGPILCDYDDMLANYLVKWIKFTRYETIASGGKRCTFRYERL
ncbi:MAG: L-2-amino-thiazoline-4-carboxylic acid hydrolase [Candidatus Thorarchaeota archaeon]|nr:L-2-amino-thiazoline-4-carboxylic acid hydrolase [Candidatus Thorarchaeota archaeon]